MDHNARLTVDGLVNSIRCALGKLPDFLVLKREVKKVSSRKTGRKGAAF